MSITITEFKFVITKHLKKKYPGPDVPIKEFYQTFKKECFRSSMNTNSTYSQKTKEERIFSTHFIEANITLTPNPERKNKNKLQTNICHELRYNNP